jgi:hypothetical protein
MALHQILRTAKAAVIDGWGGLDETLARLPEHDDDLGWDLLYDVLFQDPRSSSMPATSCVASALVNP